MLAPTLADQIAYWTARIHTYDDQVGLGLLRPDAACLAYARATLRELTDIDGDTVDDRAVSDGAK